jgi:AraC-like DNA-binding protein
MVVAFSDLPRAACLHDALPSRYRYCYAVCVAAGRMRGGAIPRPGRLVLAGAGMSADTIVKDRVAFARPRHLPGVELVSVAYRHRTFPTHLHPEYVVGTVEAGAEELCVGGVAHIVERGDVLRLHPGEPHANRCVGDATLRYRVFYLSGESIAPYLDDGRPLAFASPVARDARLAAQLAATHALLREDDGGPLEQQSALLALIGALARDGAEAPAASAPAASAPAAAIERARDYIDGHFADGFSLAALASVAGLSVFHLAHSFRAAVGFSPLAYRNQRRVIAARRLLRDGGQIADVAAAVGYADQSHLTRQFQRIVGASPGRYAQQ